jgi:CBS domain-containing protein
MRISECMSTGVQIASPNETIAVAARMMAKSDVGALPVGENDRLVGMITDRDIAIRAVAEGLGPDTSVRSVMSSDVRYCFEDEDVGHVLENMGDVQLRRLPVLNRERRLVGIVSLADVARDGDGAKTGEALGDITRPGGSHSQSMTDGSGRLHPMP